jgi:diguanylate cyclase (GGDEF)-like protein
MGQSVSGAQNLHLPLRALVALFDPASERDLLCAVLRSLRDIFTFDQALALVETPEGWQCAMGFPDALAGLTWQRKRFLDEVAAGLVATNLANHDLQEWSKLDHLATSPLQPALYIPMRVGESRGLVVLLRSPAAEPFGETELAHARQFALVAMAASAMQAATNMEAKLAELRTVVDTLRDREKELARRAYTDHLTGLANRMQIEQCVHGILQAQPAQPFALAFIDLDNFKHINDYYNHAVGDALLVKVAARISEVMRASDVLARISGDEFLLLFHPLEDEQQVRNAVDELLAKLKQPFHVDGYEMFTSASIGVSIYPAHGQSYEELRRNADSAMYQAKNGTKGGAAFFDAVIGKAMSERMQLEQRLRLAIRDRQLCCAFQPKVDIRTQEVVGFETLIRWRDSDGEFQSPLSFIGLATELGLIDPITHFVLADAVGSLDRLDEAFGPGKAIAINVAARQAGDLAFMQSLVGDLKTSGCAERFIIEVTEDAFIAKNQFQSQVLPLLRNIGVRVSIDDFGTGYSSLSVLADITADEIKIDRSFIVDIHKRSRSQSILKAIESVSHALGVCVVAEGVENFEELAYLLGATRIRYAQGYHFARPFLLDEMVRTNGARGDERSVAIERSKTAGRPTMVLRAGATGRPG